jgi:hypothetical protein
MRTHRNGFFNSALAFLVMLAAVGCGKPAPPPQGAAQDTATPTVDLGPETGSPPTGPNESGADTPNTVPESGTTPGTKGEAK